MRALFQCCAALVSFLVLALMTVIATRVVQDLTGESDRDACKLAGILVAIGCFLVLLDWINMGPTVALQSCAVAVGIAGMSVIPLGLAGLSLVQHWTVLCFVALGAGAAAILGELCGVLGFLVGVAIGVVSYLFITSMTPFYADEAANACFFLTVYWAVRRALTLRRIEHWPRTSHVDPGSEAYASRAEYFADRCKPYQRRDKFNFRLSIRNIYKVERKSQHRPKSANLFHGTSWEAAKGIVSDGFRLPAHAGMFGKGVYFADCPLKSWNYTRELDSSCCWRGGLILMCTVDLGEQRAEKGARTDLGGYDRRGWWAWLTGQHGAYDSVIGLVKEAGGALKAPEYVIYNPEQAQVDTVFEVVKEPYEE